MIRAPTPDPTLSRVVRVFISSTFRDFSVERDLLMKRVLPELRRRARERFVDVAFIDLRWGITEKQSRSGQTLPICLREIETARPYFVGLLGDRYGWTPHAEHYPNRLLEAEPWLKEHVGGKSVTELEILHGVLNNPVMAGQALFYFRERGRALPQQSARDKRRLTDLKQRIRSSSFSVQEFERADDFAERVLEDLWRRISRRFPRREVIAEDGRAAHNQDVFAEEKRVAAVVGTQGVEKLARRLAAARDGPGKAAVASRATLVIGEPGAGLSTLMAVALDAYRRTVPSGVVVAHSVEAHPENLGLFKIVNSIGERMRQLGVAIPARDGDSDFGHLLTAASAWAKEHRREVVVAIDGLSHIFDARSVSWLPRSVPPRVRLVVATRTGDWEEMIRPREWMTHRVSGLNRSDAAAMLRQSLSRQRRSLDRGSERLLVSAAVGKPAAWLAAATHLLNVVGSFEELPRVVRQVASRRDLQRLLAMALCDFARDFGLESAIGISRLLAVGECGISLGHLIGDSGVPAAHWSGFALRFAGEVRSVYGLVLPSEALRSCCESFAIRNGWNVEACHRCAADAWMRMLVAEREPALLHLHLLFSKDGTRMGEFLREPLLGGGYLASPSAWRIVERSWQLVAETAGEADLCDFIERSYSAVLPSWRGFPGFSVKPAARWVVAAESIVRLLSHLNPGSVVAKKIQRALLKLALKRRASCVRKFKKSRSLSNAYALCASSLQLSIAAGSVWTKSRHTDLDFETLDVSRWIASKSGRHTDARDLAGMLNGISVILAAEDSALQAVEYLSEARQIWKQQLSWSDLDSVEGLAQCLELLAEANFQLRRWKRALSCARSACDFYEELLRLSGSIESKQELATSFALLGRCQLELRQFRAGAASLERGLELLRGVAEYTDQSEDLLALLESLQQSEERVGELQTSRARNTERARLLEEWRSVLDTLRPRVERSEWDKQLIRWKDRSARILLASNEHREAYKCFESCRKASKNDWLRTRETSALNNFVWYSQMCASCLGHLGDPLRAKARLSQLNGFVALLRERAAGDPSYLATIEEYDRVYELASRFAPKRR